MEQLRAADLVDEALYKFANEWGSRREEPVAVSSMSDYGSQSWETWHRYLRGMPNSDASLDNQVTFLDESPAQSDYRSKRLPYALSDAPPEAYLKLTSVLYSPTERHKFEWMVGAILCGDASKIQKFLVFYGDKGSGKSTMLTIIGKIFEGYTTTFDARSITERNNQFSLEVFRSNPLVALDHDGDLSRIETNTRLNSLVSHEEITINEKHKSQYTSKFNTILFVGSNSPVKITDAKSGISRRLIDVVPTGQRLEFSDYEALLERIDFEIGAIASRCIQVYKEVGKGYYNNYEPRDMQLRTDVFYNFVDDSYMVFKMEQPIQLKRAYAMYKDYCENGLVEHRLPLYRFRDELKNYFKVYHDRASVDGSWLRSVYDGFIVGKFEPVHLTRDSERSDNMDPMEFFDHVESWLDKELATFPAQYATDEGAPISKWRNVTTTLSDLDTTKLHYVRPGKGHIVIDFDIRGPDGEKSLAENLKAASKFPPTYAEISKSGQGIHLHYIWMGRDRLSTLYSEGVEIKTFRGNSSLRRKLTKCNNLPIATISSGLPLKEEKPMINEAAVKSERGLRNLILRNLKKEIHPSTKSSCDFILKILDDAYNSDLSYDVSDMRQAILNFAMDSTNNSDHCLKLIKNMKFSSDPAKDMALKGAVTYDVEDVITFYDVEVFPNLFIVVLKNDGAKTYTRLINPEPKAMEPIFKKTLVGFNCRRYDNHILYARYLGYDNQALYELSQKIINSKTKSAGMFREAYNISHADVHDFSNTKQSLKKWEIKLGLKHQEFPLKWDQPVPEDMWEMAADYCCNDVAATEAVFHHLSADYKARLVMAELSGLAPNDTNQMHAGRILFGDDKTPQSQFKYTDLSEEFPGYTFESGKSSYRGEDPKEGGYVYAEPGMYGEAALLDAESMHPSSIIMLELFGPKYTQRFAEIKDARIAIKHHDKETASKALDGKLAKYLDNDDELDGLSYALKIFINTIYGLTSAKFENLFRDPRNKDNIVAKRGALFMIDLKHAIQEQGYVVFHIKTDSVKIADADEKIIKFVQDFGKKYGYNMQHEATFDKICLFNDAVYVGKYRWHEKAKKIGKWDATGVPLIHPYIFKTLFSHEKIEFEDMCETRSVTSSLYLDMNEGLSADEHDYKFVGRVGAFCPIKPGKGGGLLCREKDEKMHAAPSSKGYRWLESSDVKLFGKEEDIDLDYFRALVDDVVSEIDIHGDSEWFMSETPYDQLHNGILPF